MDQSLRLLPVVLIATLGLAGRSYAAVTVTIACAAVGIEHRLCREGAEAWAGSTGNTVEVVQTPNLANERLALFQQHLAARSPDIDVFAIDVVWPGTLGRHFVDLREYFDPSEIEAHFPAMVENNVVEGALKALPWYADAGLLYYRRDLLEKYGLAVPQSWAALASAARQVVEAEHAVGNTRLVGFVFQGRAYEGLTCNALEWIASHRGGTILAPDGAVSIDNARARIALETAASWIGDIAPRGVLTYAEEDARGVFQGGHAVFMRNWPYAFALVNAADSPVRNQVSVARLPRGGGDGVHASALGGGGLAVSRYSRHPGAAADLVRHLTGLEEQVRRAIEGAFNPTRPAAYAHPDLARARPFMRELQLVFTAAVPRPARIAGDRYNRVSNAFWNAVHDTLSGRGDAGSNLAAGARRIERVLGAGR